MLRAIVTRIRNLWLLALREHATPREIGLAVALGAFVGCTPFIIFHLWLALGLATVFRLNRLWAMLGSRVSLFFILPWIILAEIQVAHRFRTGAWAPLLARDALEHAREYMLDWFVGTVPIGCAVATGTGLLAYGLARRRLARPRPPSSESPP